MSLFTSITAAITILNLFFAATIIFIERRNVANTWAWLMVLVLIPGVGFILYLLFGQNLSKQKIFHLSQNEEQIISTIIQEQKRNIEQNEVPFRNQDILKYKDMIYMNLVNAHAILTESNEAEIIVDGKEKFEHLLSCIEQAQDHIHMQYYIVKDDELGKRMMRALTKKAQEGVEVRFLYDHMGSSLIKKSFYHPLIEAGGEVASFFPSTIPYLNMRINYRNHRKIAVIDGEIGFVGGFNIGDEYLGLKKLGYWRDTHLKLRGGAVYSLQARFIIDWNASSKHKIIDVVPYFHMFKTNGNVATQIVTSGPDSEWEQIKNSYIRMIYSAKKSIYIQTPYFVPDESFFTALKIAALSGVDIKIMVPNQPDHIFVYWATYSYIGELIDLGVKCYIYDNGFIHAKTIVVDSEVASIGTANIDVRSFKLNFEVNAFLYDQGKAQELENYFIEDIKQSYLLTQELYAQRSNTIKFKEAISRLLTPIL